MRFSLLRVFVGTSTHGTQSSMSTVKLSRLFNARHHFSEPFQFAPLMTNPVMFTNSKPKDEEKPKAKKPPEGFITMIDLDNNLKFTTLVEATKLSNRRGLKLIKVSDFDTKRQTPVYKIMTGAQYLKEDISSKKHKAKETGFKSEKIVTFSNRIMDHDLSSKVQHISKWLEKNYEVRITISGVEPGDKMAPSSIWLNNAFLLLLPCPIGLITKEEVYKKIEKSLKDEGRFLQKRQSGTDIKFQVIPAKEKTGSKKS